MFDVSSALKNPGQTYPVEYTLTLEPMDVLSEVIRFDEIHLAGEMVGAEESVSIRGRVRATLTAHCARCLKELQKPVSAEVDEVFLRMPDPEDPDQRPMDGHSVDLTDSIREALLLEIPIRLLCREDCAGLCPVCGQDLNDGTCTCPKGPQRANPFEALTELLTSDDEEV